MQTKTVIPLSPRSNPSIEEGVYEARVTGFELMTYGEQTSTLIRIILRLVASEKVLVTHIYFPNNDAPGSSQRLWYFCQSVGLELTDVTEQPELFKERRLCVWIKQFSKSLVDPEDCYSDVSAFYPLRCEEDDPYQVW